MTDWRRWIAGLALALAAFGVAACNGDSDEVDQPGDPEQVEEMEEQLDDMEDEVRDNTP